jgi:YVTN family beta-propeller protein
LLSVGCGAIAACTASAEDVRPPADQMFFPTGLVTSPDQTVMFVANANSELRYDSGTIGVIDLEAVQGVIEKWTAAVPEATAGCKQDPDHRETLVCDEAPLMRANAAARIGNFATDIALQDFSDGSLRVLVPTRGDPSIAWADYDGSRLICKSGSDSYQLCDDAHRLTAAHGDPNFPIPTEPFGVFADGRNGFAIVTHLSLGAVTLIDSSAGRTAEITDIRLGLFGADPTTGIRAATGVAGRLVPTTDADGKAIINDVVYVGSRTENRIQTFTVARLKDADDTARPAYLLNSSFFFLNTVGTLGGGGSSDTRSLEFSETGEQLYVVNRDPPTLQIFDTSAGPTGLPRNTAAGASDICRQASTVRSVGVGDSARVYVTCFQDGQVYVIDPRGQSQIEDVITVGRGPYGIAAAKGRDPLLMSTFLFVSNFLEDTVAVIDISPTSVHRNRVVLRIGTPRAQ